MKLLFWKIHGPHPQMSCAVGQLQKVWITSSSSIRQQGHVFESTTLFENKFDLVGRIFMLALHTNIFIELGTLETKYPAKGHFFYWIGALTLAFFMQVHAEVISASD